MLRIRLSRTGKKKQASFRVVVTDIEMKRDGRIVERIGHYNPLPDPIDYKIDEARALYWLSVGAQPTDAVRRLLEKQGTLERLQRLRVGEEFDALVAEFTSEGLEAEAEAETAEFETEAEEPEEGVAETAVAAAEAVVEAATKLAEDVTEEE